jgi:hypothetical protein
MAQCTANVTIHGYLDPEGVANASLYSAYAKDCTAGELQLDSSERQGQRIFFLSTTTSLALGPIQSLIQ